MSRVANWLNTKSAGQPAVTEHAPDGDLPILFEMSGEREACEIVGALQRSGVYPEQIEVVDFERVTVRVAPRDLESGRLALIEIREEFPAVDWAKVEIAP